MKARRLDQPGTQPSAATLMKRCAIYTRKSTEEGLDQDFTSLDNQREASEAYVRSQQHEGWVLVPTRYDDGGFTGGNMERPALKRILADVDAGKVDIVVVHRIDRLTRSLMDFGKIVQILEASGASFVSVTQQFNTTTSMGRLTLNILLSFAQFERELTTERVKEKIAAHKKLGKFTGGRPPMGYDLDRDAKKLVVNPEEAKLVRLVFKRFIETKSGLGVIREMNKLGHTTKVWTSLKGGYTPGRPWDKSALYKMLNNVTFLGLVSHKGVIYKGEHKAIIDQATWDKVQAILQQDRKGMAKPRENSKALLAGIIHCGHHACHMTYAYVKKGSRKYNYYRCTMADKRGWDSCPVKSVPAGEIEKAVLGQVRVMFQTPEVVAQVQRALQDSLDSSQLPEGLNKGDVPARERDLIPALENLDAIWEELFPQEKARIFQLLIQRVEVHPDRLDVSLRTSGFHGLVQELAVPA